MSSRPAPTQPCQFGASSELFGMYHATAGRPACAVLMCPPLGQEMIRSYRIYRQLADALARQGCAALRFDYYGSGDSAGSSHQLDWARCIDDTLTAAIELRERSGSERVVCFGARLGGSIAMDASVDARFSELLLWDPVLDGRTHVTRLDAMQNALRLDTHRFSHARTAKDAADQWLGFPVNADLRQRISAWQPRPLKTPALWLDTQPTPAVPSPHTGFDTVQRLQTTTVWDALNRLEHSILSPELIRTVLDHLRVPG